MGLVSQVFHERDLELLQGHIAVGHTRYSTTGSPSFENAQPTLGPTPFGTVALAHNGNLTNFDELEALADSRSDDANRVVAEATKKRTRTRAFRDSSNDTSLVTELFATEEGENLTDAALRLLPQVDGAFSLVFMDEHTLYAARDPQGVRPLSLGRLSNGWVVASETAALDIVGASYVRDIEPGELIAIDEDGLRSFRFAEAKQAHCVFEYVYLARPDSVLDGQIVHGARTRWGAGSPRSSPSTPTSSSPPPNRGRPLPSLRRGVGDPVRAGPDEERLCGRTFIQPSQTLRELGIRLKLNPIRENIEGKRLVVVDDSIVRGNTQRALVRMLREAGAKEIHIRISSPPVKWPCYYGIDFATRAELIANGLNVEEICTSLGADSLGYISLDGMIEATKQKRDRLCTACFSGEYPIPVNNTPADKGC